MSSTGKISMALDEIIQQKKSAKKEKKINPIKRAFNNHGYQQKHFENDHYNNNRQFSNFRRGSGFRGNNRGSIRGSDRGSIRGSNRGGMRGSIRGSNRGGMRGSDRGRFRGGRGERRGFRGENLNNRGRDHQNQNVNREYQQGQQKRQSITLQQVKKCRLRISNLSSDVTNQELYEIFSEIGKLKRCGIHWDGLGKSKGTADVEYFNNEDATKAIKSYNSIQIDYLDAECQGKLLRVEYRDDVISSAYTERGGIKRKRIKTISSLNAGRNQGTERGRGRGRGRRGRGRGREYV